jgi:hypothetical protein
MQQAHLFANKETGYHATWTMADVVERGLPIDPDSGEDLEYAGPVIQRTGSIVVAAEGTERLCIADLDTGATRVVEMVAE